MSTFVANTILNNQQQETKKQKERNDPMLANPTLYKIQQLRLHTMAAAFKEQLESPTITCLSFEERLGLLIDA
ncbi:MAG: hypothetical protein ACD_16C00256G0002 [uncultured bacterium]|nr:MAG: hypothetical protein ACD_16C00256G0002 [uncultured bacterium]